MLAGRSAAENPNPVPLFSAEPQTAFRCQQAVCVSAFFCQTAEDEARALTGEDDSASCHLRLSENKKLQERDGATAKVFIFVSFRDAAAAFLLPNDKVTMKSCSFTSSC